MHWSDSGQGQVEGCYEHCNKYSGSIKCSETIECLEHWWPRVVFSSTKLVRQLVITD
jgi:hypothetical protein